MTVTYFYLVVTAASFEQSSFLHHTEQTSHLTWWKHGNVELE